MSYRAFDCSLRTKAKFYLRTEGEGLIRRDGSGFAYLRAYGWVMPCRQDSLRLLALHIEQGSDPSEAATLVGRLRSLACSGRPNKQEVDLWEKCSLLEAHIYALRLFRYLSPEMLEEKAVGRCRRLSAYIENHDLLGRRGPVPYGPAPWGISRDTQEKAQELEAQIVKAQYPHISGFSLRMDDWIAQARNGYEQEQLRVEGIQQRASFIIGAAGITTAGVLANGSLLFGKEILLKSLEARILVGGLLTMATFGLAIAAYAALQATMVMFELAQPNSPWQLERRIGHRVSKCRQEEELRDVLATTLLAARRAEAIGDWKVRRLRQARRRFTAAIALLVVANFLAFVFLIFS